MRPLIRLTILSIFLVALLVVSGSIQQTPSIAQTKTEPRFFCNYGEGNRGAELCARMQGRTFKSNIHAERAVDMIVKPLGLKRNFVLVPCPSIENAAAVTYEDGVRYIIYDNAFMGSIDSGANTDWASVSILAHEIGHHLQGHTTRLVHHPLTKEERRQSREDELEADEFSGFAMFKLGRSLDEAQAAMKKLRDVDDEENSDHPENWRRLEAIKRGYEDARSQQPTQVQNPPLYAPSQISPADREVFNIYPRTTKLVWSSVTGAASYTVETDFSNDGRWCSEIECKYNSLDYPWRTIQRNIMATEYTYDFVGAQPGRWRVWAVSADGHEGPKSSWHTFTYTR